jgi:hypothetical protein
MLGCCDFSKARPSPISVRVRDIQTWAKNKLNTQARSKLLIHQVDIRYPQSL